jgi:ApaG protein
MSDVVYTYHKITHGIAVSVNSFFLENESQPEKNHYIWAYQILIENSSNAIIQILSRRWTITDSWSKVRTVKGEGIVGQQPILEPGDSFEYASSVPLSTSNGFMCGSYEIVQTETRVLFEVEIPLFSLDSPYANYAVN